MFGGTLSGMLDRPPPTVPHAVGCSLQALSTKSGLQPHEAVDAVLCLVLVSVLLIVLPAAAPRLFERYRYVAACVARIALFAQPVVRNPRGMLQVFQASTDYICVRGGVETGQLGGGRAPGLAQLGTWQACNAASQLPVTQQLPTGCDGACDCMSLIALPGSILTLPVTPPARRASRPTEQAAWHETCGSCCLAPGP